MAKYLKTTLKETFIRSSSNANHYDALDGIRAISILLVLAFHNYYLGTALFGDITQGLLHFSTNSIFSRITAQGDIGVDLFFVLSGFLITTQLLQENARKNSINRPWFFAKRLLRIYPLYAVLITIMLLVRYPHYDEAWKNYLLINNLTQSNFIRHSWSIAVEMHFYLIAPFFIAFLITAKRPFTILAIIAAVLLLIRFNIYTNMSLFDNNTVADFIVGLGIDKPVALKKLNTFNNFIYEPTHMRIVTFIPGIAAAWIYHYHFEKFKAALRNSKINLIIVLALAAIFIWALGIDKHPLSSTLDTPIKEKIYLFVFTTWRFIIASLGALIILFSLSEQRGTLWMRNFLSHKLFYPISKTSYSIYLFNFFMIGLAYFTIIAFTGDKFKLIEGVNKYSSTMLFINFLLSLFYSLILGIICYALVERWFLKGKIRDWAKNKFG